MRVTRTGVRGQLKGKGIKSVKHPHSRRVQKGEAIYRSTKLQMCVIKKPVDSADHFFRQACKIQRKFTTKIKNLHKR